MKKCLIEYNLPLADISEGSPEHPEEHEALMELPREMAHGWAQMTRIFYSVFPDSCLSVQIREPFLWTV